MQAAFQQKLLVEEVEVAPTEGFEDGSADKGRDVLRHRALLPMAQPNAEAPVAKPTPLTLKSE